MAEKKTFTDQYRDYLVKVGRSPQTVKAYSHDLASFARWFEQTSGEDFDPQAVDPRDIREYKGYLVRQGLTTDTILYHNCLFPAINISCESSTGHRAIRNFPR